MTKKELAYLLSDKYGVPKGVTLKVVQGVLDYVIEILIKDKRLELRNFGVFEVKTRKPRIGRNPKTREAVPIPERRVVKFKPGKMFKDRMKEL